MERRLAAILAADVVGYSKLMSEDETGTLAALKAHRADVFDPATARYNGRIVKLMGDGVLVEFASVVDAVQCALAVQTALKDAEDDLIRLRIGINLGDVIIDGDDIYGDGVNIAARLEAMAEPGGICVSSIVHESLGHRVDADFSDAGPHQFKNINNLPLPLNTLLKKPLHKTTLKNMRLPHPEDTIKHTLSNPKLKPTLQNLMLLKLETNTQVMITIIILLVP